MHTFRDVIIGRAVPLDTDQDYKEMKMPDALTHACEKLPMLPIYYGIRHGDVDEHGGIKDAIGRVLNLHYDPGRGVVGDVEYDVLPEDLLTRKQVNYSLWYHTATETPLPGGVVGLGDIMFKHVLATSTPVDPGTGHMIGESKDVQPLQRMSYMTTDEPPLPDIHVFDVTPPVTPHPSSLKSVSQPISGSETAMPDQNPEPEPKAPAAPTKPLSSSPPVSPEPAMPADYAEAREELIEALRDELAPYGLPDPALKAMNLKALRATLKHYKEQAAKPAESEHPSPEGRQGLPKPYAPADTEHPELITTEEGQYFTVPGFVEKLQGKFTDRFGSQPFIPVTGPVGQYGNVSADKKKR